MDTLVNRENENAVANKQRVETRFGGVRKPLRGVENKARNVPVKASFKDKAKVISVAVNAKENVKVNKLVKTGKVKSEQKEALETIPTQLLASLPVVKSEEVKCPDKLPENVDDIDSEDKENPQLVSIYVNDIYRYLWKLEVLFPIKRLHLQMQPEITGKMRAVLIDWLVQVHLKFHLLQETLYLTVSILDRYLQVDYVKRAELQLVGVTAMFIASKYEEMYAPEVGDFVYITDNTYTKQEIFKMERKMLRKLDFNLSKPLHLHFLRRNSKAGNVDATMHALAKYLMELVLLEYEMSHHSPSIVAAAALNLSLRLLADFSWNDTLKYFSNYSEEDIMPVVKALAKIVIRADSSKLQAVRAKYASSKLCKISTIPQLKSSVVKELAGAIK
ncbi:G2/mitotic-specific cyclin-B-like [Uloborus diversus]|uniref:G2/mitotic-specific cyclin-B-like n=1 Tax=Uloborus diversus TaxID=327109 RepID=UPI0024092478|nr:G2/mitotic-specific cyclin-B-like [Uloborus diversus]